MLPQKLLILASVVILAGCTSDPVSTGNQNFHNQQNRQFSISKSSFVSREIINSVDTRITQQASSINQFAIKMYSQLSKDTGNIFFSPYSITCALGMTDVGAVGSTSDQIREALQVTLEGDDFYTGINGLDQSLMLHSDNTPNLELKIANSIWSQQGLSLCLPFLDKLAKNYDAGINILDFEKYPEPSRIIINDWISEQTNQRIKDLIPPGEIDCETRLVLTNAIYFIADWLLKFDPEKTTDQEFTTSEGNRIMVPMMTMGTDDPDKLINFLYNKNQVASLLELPYYGNRIVMDLILPEQSLNQLETSITTDLIKDLCNFRDSTALQYVKIPKFQFTTKSISLVEAFYNLGMIIPFNGSADFSGICRLPLYIANILHKAFIKVDETGTEAAAATAVIMKPTSTEPFTPPTFVANRPFIYLIRDTQTNTILFMGRVHNPMVTK